MGNNDKKSLSELRKSLSEKVLDKEEMDKLKGGKDVGQFDKDKSNDDSNKWNGFGGILPQ
jgi:natural product precursor